MNFIQLVNKTVLNLKNKDECIWVKKRSEQRFSLKKMIL